MTWLTVDDAARLAKVSRWTIYAAIANGDLTHSRIAGRRSVRLTPDALDEWLLRHSRAANVESSPTA